jgi:hypothetical protein
MISTASDVGGWELGLQAGDEDVEASFEFGGSVIVSEDGGEAAEEGELSDRESM